MLRICKNLLIAFICNVTPGNVILSIVERVSRVFARTAGGKLRDPSLTLKDDKWVVKDDKEGKSDLHATRCHSELSKNLARTRADNAVRHAAKSRLSRF